MSMKPIKVPKFLKALYRMLATEDPNIISWSSDGHFFQIYDITRLEKEILSKYFKHNNFSSFQRQLNNFGFRKWTKTRANVCTFSHDTLRRCEPGELTLYIFGMKPSMESFGCEKDDDELLSTLTEEELDQLLNLSPLLNPTKGNEIQTSDIMYGVKL
ncbi:unnamed protein product [Albugo candida]|uniref:HSF-type DNA-binding domain-containing protein n=1 Tax=Albugo candida TaxID=65357 RepID=A0A024FZ46_9STRA|nr:unnamed protein product [Albugo candida]|eukprot:CCI39844.1 unnamed protein product [Albugo candida]